MKRITIIMMFLFIIILCPNSVYADACGFDYEYSSAIQGEEFTITISKCNQEFEYYVEYDKTILEYKESTSYSNSICVGNNYKDIVNVTDKDGKLTINRKVQGNCNISDGNESYVTLKFKTLKTGETSLKISPTNFLQQVNGKNETVETDSKTGMDVLKIKINVFEKGTILPSCPKCEECKECPKCEECKECPKEKECEKCPEIKECEKCEKCPKQEKCENIKQKEDTTLPIVLTISVVGNIGLLTALIIIINKQK